MKKSPLNIGRTTARNARRQMKHAQNVADRAALHRSKASARSPEDAAAYQLKIDAMSKK